MWEKPAAFSNSYVASPTLQEDWVQHNVAGKWLLVRKQNMVVKPQQTGGTMSNHVAPRTPPKKKHQ